MSMISDEAIIHPGCRILGDSTSIGPGCEIGAEGPVTIENCQLGRNVSLKSGYFSGAVFLDGSSMAAGAHVRSGTLLEEEANGAHTVGLKQTVLLPFVTLGSLINFCDVLMAGGTDRKNHGEVGSSYIHFNFTPHQDKATASLLGDVPRGVLMNQNPIFLGGQGGLVGPSRIAYGSVIAAGGVCRADVLAENQLHVPATPQPVTCDYDQTAYKRVDRIVKNCLIYAGNIKALKAWYESARILFVRDAFDQAVFDGALRNLNLILAERIQRLEQLAGNVSASMGVGAAGDAAIATQKQFIEGWDSMREVLSAPVAADVPTGLLTELKKEIPAGYLAAVRGLSAETRAATTDWLQSIVDDAANGWVE